MDPIHSSTIPSTPDVKQNTNQQLLIVTINTHADLLTLEQWQENGLN